MTRTLIRTALFGAALLVAAVVLPARPAVADPPGRVGRVAYLAGTASYHGAGDAGWSPATLNYPVTSGDAFWTEPGSLADIRIGSTAIHLDGGTELDIARLDDAAFEATLPQGAANIRLRVLSPGESYFLATPRGTVVLAAAGTYHVEAGGDRAPTRVTVLSGRALLLEPDATITVEAGETAELDGPAEAPAYAILPAAPTDFDNWALARDQREERPQSLAYVPRGMTGYEDLDRYGNWRTDPEYGAVWYPAAVPVDWVPYRYGHWRWVAPWGWTWIDDAPWGFAPFHYGRWAQVGGRWGWMPGRIVARPVYAPALVVFIGGASRSSHFAPGGGPSVGWVPLGPREAFRPAYAASPAYVRNVNIAHGTNVRGTRVTDVPVGLANRSHATIVPRAAFEEARPVAHAALHVPERAGPPVAPGAALPQGTGSPARREQPREAAAPGPPIPGPGRPPLAHDGERRRAEGQAATDPRGPQQGRAGERSRAIPAERTPGPPPAMPETERRPLADQRPGGAPTVAAPAPGAHALAAPREAERRPAAEPRPAGTTAPASPRREERAAASPTAAAPGPPIPHPTAPAIAQRAPQPPAPPPRVAERAREQTPRGAPPRSLPAERQIPHPQQQGALAPTPGGWTRQTAPPHEERPPAQRSGPAKGQQQEPAKPHSEKPRPDQRSSRQEADPSQSDRTAPRHG